LKTEREDPDFDPSKEFSSERDNPDVFISIKSPGIKITCYSCGREEECGECGRDMWVEGITYDLDDFTLEKQADAIVLHICPVCGSYRTEM